MTLAIVLVGLLLLIFPGAFARRAWHCPPAEWARVTALALAVGAATVYLGLVLTALPTVLEGVHLDGIASICGDVLRRLTWGQEPVGWTAAVISVALPVLAVRALLHARRSARRAHIEPWLGEHVDHGEYELVLVPVRALVAVGVPGRQPQVVISTGLVSELDEPRLDAVIRHEVAHHRLGHRRSLVLASVIDRAFRLVPFVSRSTHTLARLDRAVGGCSSRRWHTGRRVKPPSSDIRRRSSGEQRRRRAVPRSTGGACSEA